MGHYILCLPAVRLAGLISGYMSIRSILRFSFTQIFPIFSPSGLIRTLGTLSTLRPSPI